MGVARAWDELALVDVELLVSGGAPRRAFRMRRIGSPVSMVPTFSLDLDELVAAGWRIDGDGNALMPPPGVDGEPARPHPYALGDRWHGANCWTAEFPLTMEQTARAVVDHLWCQGRHPDFDAGAMLASGSPWRWQLTVGPLAWAGRAESPLAAAAEVERMLAEIRAPREIG